MKKQDILKAIFEETTNGLGPNRRYIARGFGIGSGWGVWDVLENKYLSNNLVELNESNFRELINND